MEDLTVMGVLLRVWGPSNRVLKDDEKWRFGDVYNKVDVRYGKVRDRRIVRRPVGSSETKL